MDIHIEDLTRVSGLIRFFFPDYTLKKGEFKAGNSIEMIRLITLITDALIKGENFRKRQNLDLPGDQEFFTDNIVAMLRNISFYLQRFETGIFRFTRTERQTFLFVIENIQEFLLSSGDQATAGRKSDGFLDHKFWIENLFKIIDQKFAGRVLELTDDVDTGSIPLGPGEKIRTGDLFFSSGTYAFSLSPFAVIRKKRILLLTGEREGKPEYRTSGSRAKKSLTDKFLSDQLMMFKFANLDLWKGATGLSWQGTDPAFDPDFSDIRSAYEYYRSGMHEKSYPLLARHLDTLDKFPLYRLLQIKNISKKNDRAELRRALENFIRLNPNYYQGFELMGLLNEKEENPAEALENYEKSIKLKQNKEILNRIKKLKSGLEKGTVAPSPAAASNPFISLSKKEFASPGQIIAREKEIREIIEILHSRTRNNLLLVGDSGVGKTALIRLLAQKIIDNEVPESLKGKNLLEINFVSLVTGTKYRGQFEEKVVKILKEFKSKQGILVLEDIHLMMSQGAARGTSMDLVNILKQFMRDGEIQVIATSSYEEFKSIVERDTSLMAFFQRMFINQLSTADTLRVLKNESEKVFEAEGITLEESVLEEIVENSRGNIMGKKLPDAALLVFERAVSRAGLRWNRSVGEENRVTLEDISEVLSDILNLPDPDVSFTLRERLSKLEKKINSKIIGQKEAVKKLTSGIMVSKLGFDVKEERPDGVFLFVGPTGVGKSETALILSKYLYGSPDNLVRIDMSEYMERFTYSRFVGAAPGYVGYNDSTQLTDKIRQNPYSVILLDEIEKADYQLLNIFLQVFDAGRLTDARGNVIDFSHATIIMTSNIGTDLFSKTMPGYRQREGADVTQTSLKKALKKYFSPEFLNRIDEIVMFRNLDPADIRKIIDLQLEGTVRKLEKQGKTLKLSEKLAEHLVSEGYSPEYGARNISRTIKTLLLEKLARLSLKPDWDEGNLVNCTLKNGRVKVEVLSVPPGNSEEKIPVQSEGRKEKEKNG